ncbi:MAG: hypothetical protein ACLPUG_06610 [Acidimicrobiales bacterium]|jgi:hypothetical protein
MSDTLLFIGWNRPARGREAAAVAVFGEGVQYFGELKARGEIESFEPFFLEPHGGDLNGFFLVRGEKAKLDRLRSDDEHFQRWITTAGLTVDGIGVLSAVTGELVAQGMSVYVEASAALA